MFRSITRRDFMKGMLAGGVAAGSAGLLAACGSSTSSSEASSSSSEEDDSSSGETTETTETETTEEVVEELTWGEQMAAEHTGFLETQMDLGGRTLTMACLSGTYSPFVYATDDNGNIDVAGTSNSTLENIAHIESIEEDYNCSIEFVSCAQKEMPTLFITALSGGEPYADLAYYGMTGTYMDTMYAAGVFIDLNEDPVADVVGLDINPWILGTDVCDFKGKQYGVPGYHKAGYVGVGSMIGFNKTLAEQYGLPDLYELVENNEWNWDKFEELLATVKAAADDSVTPAVSEKYNQLFPGIAASNGTTIMSSEDGTVIWNGLTDDVLDAFNYVVQLIEEGYLVADDGGRSYMLAGTAVFDFGGYNTVAALSKGTLEASGDWTFGLLPYPTGPSNTEGYNSELYSTNQFNVLTGTENPEEVAAIMIAIINRCGMTHEEFLDYALENVVQDEESLDMIEIASDNVVFDYCQAYNAIRSGSGLNSALQSIQKLEKTPKQAMEEIDSQVLQAIEDSYNYTEEE